MPKSLLGFFLVYLINKKGGKSTYQKLETLPFHLDIDGPSSLGTMAVPVVLAVINAAYI